ncbi:hypothetical protein KUTeg_022660 [Tegillarca granosa]|uniref:C2H2-type domain-containing protein n=1 Tax=Tegillarca granosa TaxID=220873 RepID=A0ABQ9E528_TEGGR|nr:hypothetical protein KUTeg_022660 [Tegillarca granosa]
MDVVSLKICTRKNALYEVKNDTVWKLYFREASPSKQTAKMPLRPSDIFDASVLKNIDIDRFINFTCKFCSTTCNSELELKEHLLKTHGKDYLEVCRQCGKCFFSAIGYREHLLTTHNSGSTGSTCSVCGKYFTCNSRLAIHMKSHSEDRQYQCPICLKSYKHKYNLKGHTCLLTTQQN